MTNMRLPPVEQNALDGFVAGFAGSDADDLFDVGDEDFSVADVAGAGGIRNDLDRFVGYVIGNDDFQFDFRHEVDNVFGSTVRFFVTFLTTKAANFGNGHSFDLG